MSRPPRDRKGRPSAQPPSADAPSVGAIIAGIAGLAGAIGLGYLLGSASRDDDEEVKETQRELSQERQRLQLRHQLISQRQAGHSYYPAVYSNNNASAPAPAPPASLAAHRERKEADDRAEGVAKRPLDQRPEGIPASSSSPAVRSSSSSSASGVSISAPMPRPASAAAGSPDYHHLSQQLDDATLCKVCMDAPMDCVLWPCRHQCCCFSCSQQLEHCPICRDSFTSAERVYRA